MKHKKKRMATRCQPCSHSIADELTSSLGLNSASLTSEDSTSDNSSIVRQVLLSRARDAAGMAG
jgi:hypothetical protein